jgi:hypothetical protein
MRRRSRYFAAFTDGYKWSVTTSAMQFSRAISHAPKEKRPAASRAFASRRTA